MTGAEPLGSATEEAARLLDAVRRWVDERVPASEGSDASTDCRFCPFCQAASALRNGQPDVFEHVGHAVASLLAAVQAGMTSQEAQWSRPERPDVEHIDIN